MGQWVINGQWVTFGSWIILNDPLPTLRKIVPHLGSPQLNPPWGWAFVVLAFIPPHPTRPTGQKLLVWQSSDPHCLFSKNIEYCSIPTFKLRSLGKHLKWNRQDNKTTGQQDNNKATGQQGNWTTQRWRQKKRPKTSYWRVKTQRFKKFTPNTRGGLNSRRLFAADSKRDAVNVEYKKCWWL